MYLDIIRRPVRTELNQGIKLTFERHQNCLILSFEQLTDQEGIIIQNIGCPVFLIDLVISGGHTTSLIEVPCILSKPNHCILR